MIGEKLVFDVSGMRYECSEALLVRFPKSLLGNKSKRLEYYDEKSGTYVFDCNRHIFSSILLFYQSNGKVLLKPQYFPPYLFVEGIVFFGLHHYRPSKKITFGKFAANRSQSTVSLISECTKNFVTDSQSSKEAMIYNNMNFGAIITTIILIILETVQLPDNLRSIFVTLERTCNVFFVCDIVLILLSRIENLRALVRPSFIFDILSIIPFVFPNR
jgi:hypothetical protein